MNISADNLPGEDLEENETSVAFTGDDESRDTISHYLDIIAAIFRHEEAGNYRNVEDEMSSWLGAITNMEIIMKKSVNNTPHEVIGFIDCVQDDQDKEDELRIYEGPELRDETEKETELRLWSKVAQNCKRMPNGSS